MEGPGNGGGGGGGGVGVPLWRQCRAGGGRAGGHRQYTHTRSERCGSRSISAGARIRGGVPRARQQQGRRSAPAICASRPGAGLETPPDQIRVISRSLGAPPLRIRGRASRHRQQPMPLGSESVAAVVVCVGGWGGGWGRERGPRPTRPGAPGRPARLRASRLEMAVWRHPFEELSCRPFEPQLSTIRTIAALTAVALTLGGLEPRPPAGRPHPGCRRRPAGLRPSPHCALIAMMKCTGHCAVLRASLRAVGRCGAWPRARRRRAVWTPGLGRPARGVRTG